MSRRSLERIRRLEYRDNVFRLLLLLRSGRDQCVSPHLGVPCSAPTRGCQLIAF